MRRLILPLTLAAAFVACDDNSTPSGPTDTTDTTGGDTSTTPDAVTPDTTSPDTTTPDTTTPDTTTPDTTTPERLCTDAELTTFDACVSACPTGPTQQQCASACQNGLSAGCRGAYSLLATCVQNNNCLEQDGSLDTQCVSDFCLGEFESVFGIPEPDDCDPVTNVGCEAGENCTLGDADNNLYCLPAGTVALYGDCTADPTACVRGACLGSEAEASCLPFCDDSADCTDGRPCNIGLQGTDLTFCGDIPTSCNVLTQDCTNGEGCYIISQAGATDCSPSNGIATGQSCRFLNDCQPGNICAGGAGAGKCSKFCDTAVTPSTCPEGTTCQGLGITGTTLGACAAAGN